MQYIYISDLEQDIYSFNIGPSISIIFQVVVSIFKRCSILDLNIPQYLIKSIYMYPDSNKIVFTFYVLFDLNIIKFCIILFIIYSNTILS